MICTAKEMLEIFIACVFTHIDREEMKSRGIKVKCYISPSLDDNDNFVGYFKMEIDGIRFVELWPVSETTQEFHADMFNILWDFDRRYSWTISHVVCLAQEKLPLIMEELRRRIG